VFLKIGAIMYGSGYVLIAFLRADFVERLHWLTDRQLLDAVAMGQVTPGPVSTTATFIGYQLFGVPGALVATLGIFVPSFCFVGLLFVFMDRIRNSPPLRLFLDAVNAASLALMAVVTFQLLQPSLPDIYTALIAGASLAMLLRTRINSIWLIGAGALLGLMLNLTQMVS
jgi:chromate transporter